MCPSVVVTTILAAEESSKPDSTGLEASGVSNMEISTVDELWQSTTLLELAFVARRREFSKCPSWFCVGISLVTMSVAMGVCISGSLFKLFMGEKSYSEMGKLYLRGEGHTQEHWSKYT